MATKKITIEVDANTDKAKRKIEAMGGESSIDGQAGLGQLSKSLDKAAKSADSFSGDVGRASGSMNRLVRGFVGMGVGLAASYAASHMQQGAARDAVEYGAAALAGGSTGAMIGSAGGPGGTAVGAVVGAGAGLAKTYLDKDAEQAAYTKAFEESERRYASAKAWRDRFSSLTDPDGQTPDARMAALKAELEKYRDAEGKIAGEVRTFAAKGQYDIADHQRRSLDENRSRQNQLEAAIKALESNSARGGSSPSHSALDALSRLGAEFGGGGGVRALEQTGKDQLATLKSIERKIGGSQVWP